MNDQEIALRASKLDQDRWDLIRRVLERRVITTNGCWEFNGKLNDKGYGVAKYKGRRVNVHRTLFKFLKPEEYREDLLVCHRCNNRKCFNLDHLYAGTSRDNFNDSVKAGTARIAVQDHKSHCPVGHEYTVENTIIDPKTKNRKCRQCYIKYQEQYRAQRMLVKLLNKMKK